jgi:UDP-N-acetylmuramate dehydrogenase
MNNPAPGCISECENIGAGTYYGIGGTAAYFARPRSVEDVRSCLAWARNRSLPIAVLGSGSNSLFADGLFNGVVICLSELTTCYWETEDTLYAEAGVTNTELAEICLDAGRAGAAWMYRMPGQLGATVRMNARCYGGEISQIAVQIFTIDVHGLLHIHSGGDVFQGYKKTLLMDGPEIVIAARLHFPTRAARTELLSFMENCEADRHRKHHFDHPSCGSTFKNNYTVGRPSGQIFDTCGLKGERRGQSEVSQFHANFVWNLGNATASDMLSLAAHMRERAQKLCQADLELEVQPIGLFEEPLFHACALDRLGPSVDEGAKKWVGLLWHPDHVLPSSAHVRARADIVLEAPFLGYFRTPFSGKPELLVRLVQLVPVSVARTQPEAPFLRWETVKQTKHHVWHDLFPIQPTEAKGFIDELWNNSVSELFIAHGDPASNSYFEFECTPEGHWVAIAFDAARKRRPEHAQPSAQLWPPLPFDNDESKFSLSLPFALLEPLIHDMHLRFQACLSLGGEGWYLAPHWAPSGSRETWDSQQQPSVKPDFHQPQRFWRVALKP